MSFRFAGVSVPVVFVSFFFIIFDLRNFALSIKIDRVMVEDLCLRVNKGPYTGLPSFRKLIYVVSVSLQVWDAPPAGLVGCLTSDALRVPILRM